MDQEFNSNTEKIISALKIKSRDMTCPMCRHKDFMLTGGYFMHDSQANFTNRQIGGVSVPVVPLICKNCGFILEYAAGVLGLLERKENSDEIKKE